MAHQDPGPAPASAPRTPPPVAVPPAPLVRLHDVEKSYGTHRGVSNLSLTLDGHGVVGLLGPNGSGKTTTLRLIAGILPPTRGAVELLGRPTTAPEAGAMVGYVPECPPLYTEMTVEDYLMFVARLRGLGPGSAAAVQRVLHDAGLEDHAHSGIASLSRGYRQRVSLAQGFVHAPRVLLLDEPTTGLDPDFALEMSRVIAELGTRCLVVLSSHVLAEVERLAGDVIVLREGRLAARWDLAASSDGPVALEARADLATVRSALGALTGAATAVEPTSQADSSRTRVRALTRAAADEAVRLLVAAGVAIDSLGPAGRDLRTLYLEASRCATTVTPAGEESPDTSSGRARDSGGG